MHATLTPALGWEVRRPGAGVTAGLPPNGTFVLRFSHGAAPGQGPAGGYSPSSAGGPGPRAPRSAAPAPPRSGSRAAAPCRAAPGRSRRRGKAGGPRGGLWPKGRRTHGRRVSEGRCGAGRRRRDRDKSRGGREQTEGLNGSATRRRPLPSCPCAQDHFAPDARRHLSPPPPPHALERKGAEQPPEGAGRGGAAGGEAGPGGGGQGGAEESTTRAEAAADRGGGAAALARRCPGAGAQGPGGRGGPCCRGESLEEHKRRPAQGRRRR